MKLGLRIVLIVVIVLIVLTGVAGVKVLGPRAFLGPRSRHLPLVPSTSHLHGCNADSIWRTQSGACVVIHRMTGASAMIRFSRG